jgi:hypothetical protein
MKGLVAGCAATRPWAGIDGVVLPLLATTYSKHDDAKEKHDQAPPQIQVYAERSLVDGRMPRNDSVDAHDSTDDQEDQSKRDADIETHDSPCLTALRRTVSSKA